MRNYQIIVFFSLLLIITGCGKEKTPLPPPDTNQTGENKNNESLLVFKNISLEESDAQGKTLWKIKAEKAAYTQEKKEANLENLAGNLYQEGEVVLQVSANKGKIEANGEIIWLENNIIAIDPRNKIEIKAEKAHWKPKENLLIIDSKIIGNHPELQITADKGQYFTKEEKLEINNNILGKLIKNNIQVKTEQLIWNIPGQKIIGNLPLDIEKYQNNTVTDKLKAGKGEINLKTEIAYLQENLELNSLDPSLQIAGKTANWNINSRLISTENPIKIIDQKEQITVTGNQGQINLQEKMAYLKNGVNGQSLTNGSQLYANNMTWNISQELFTAEGNVIYQQIDPQLIAKGNRAIGKLTEKNISVSSNQGERVVTEIEIQE